MLYQNQSVGAAMHTPIVIGGNASAMIHDVQEVLDGFICKKRERILTLFGQKIFSRGEISMTKRWPDFEKAISNNLKWRI